MEDFEIQPQGGLSIDELKQQAYAELAKALSQKEPLAVVEGLDALMAKKILDKCMTGDNEMDHINADKVLIEVLESAGMEMMVAAWKSVGKWYS